jgi:hypothetical protein
MLAQAPSNQPQLALKRISGRPDLVKGPLGLPLYARVADPVKPLDVEDLDIRLTL